jgi:hypothetical protein
MAWDAEPRLHRLGACVRAVVALFPLLLIASASSLAPERESGSPYPNVQRVATLQNRDVNESSGLMAAGRSGADEELFWTHNDSGDGPILYLCDRRGAHRGAWRLTGAGSLDAEDCAAGPGPERNRRYLYYGDIGDNFSFRSNCVIWRVPEPTVPPDAPRSSRAQPIPTSQAEALPFAYPDGPHDCEALLVQPTTGRIYVVTKERDRGTSGVYRFPEPQAPGRKETLVKVAEISPAGSRTQSLVTAGDVSPDGRRVILRDYQRLYEYSLPVAARGFDDIWKQKPRVIPSPKLSQGEAVCYSRDGRSLYLTSENLPTPLYQLSP